MSKATEREIEKLYKKIFAKIYDKYALAKLFKGSKKEILTNAAKLASSKAYDEFAKKFAKELSKKGLLTEKGIWRKYYEAAKKFNYIALPKTWTEFENIQMQKAIEHNFTMIKSIPSSTLKILEREYTETLINQAAKNKIGRKAFEKELKSHGAKNAKVIARTEAAKLQTAIVENRAKDLGSVVYQWKSSNDKRTRPSHKMMNNVIVFWRKNENEKPLLDDMNGNAGEFPNCRCAPLMIFNELDLTNNKYQVYDYRSHKIINMSKSQLLIAMEKGSL